MESPNIDELLSRVKRGFDSPNSPYGLINNQQTAVTCDAWIQQPRQPSMESPIIDELLSRVTRGFDSPHSPWDSEIIIELLSRVTRGFDSPQSH